MPEPLPVLGDNDGVGRDGAAMARRYMPNAIAALVRALDDPDRYVQAAQILLDRGYGKPREYVETNNTNVNVSQGIDAPEIPSREGIDVWLARRRREIAEAAMAAASERVAKGRNGSEGPTTH